MANIKGGRKNGLHWRSYDTSHNLDTGGVFNATNTNRIFRLMADGTWQSWRKNRAINAFNTLPVCDGTSGPAAGRTLLIDAAQDITFNGDSQLPVWTHDDGTESLSPTVLADDVTPWVFVHSTGDKVPNFKLFSGTVRSSGASGNWTSSSTWSGGGTPSADEIIVIKSGHTVTMNNTSTTRYKAVVVENGGTLTFSTSVNAYLRVIHFLVRETATVNVGTVGTPVPNGTTATVEFANVALDTTNDPAQFGNGLVALGTLNVCGYDRGAPFLRATGDILSGATTVTLESAATNWQVGDRIAVPDSRQWATGQTVGDHTEVRTIASFDGTKTQVTLSSALTYDHKGARDDVGSAEATMRPHLLNLTRNVVFRSESTSVPGHCIVMGRGSADVRNALFFELARTTGDVSLDSTTFSGDTATHIGTNQIGRYPLHFHHCAGRTASGAGYAFRVQGCVFDGGNNTAHFRKWGLTVHGTSYGLVQDNVCHNVFGGGFVFEDGTEVANSVTGNFSNYIRGYGGREDLDSATTGFARNGGGFWMRAMLSRFSGNKAAGCQGYGLIVNCLSLAKQGLPTYQGSDHGSGATNYQLLGTGSRGFSDFEAYGCNGVTWWIFNFFGFTLPAPSAPRMLIDNITVWNTVQACYHYPVGNATMKNWVIRGDPTLFGSGDASRGFSWHDDYRTQSVVISGCNIQGIKHCILLSPDIVGRILIENTTTRGGYGVVVQTANANGTSGSSSAPNQRERLVTITNCDLTPTTRTADGSQVTTKYEVRAQAAPGDPAYTNYVVGQQLYFYSRNGVAGANWKLYFSEQAASSVLALSTSTKYACPESGLTNQQAHDKYVPWAPGMTGTNIPIKSDNPNPATPGLCTWGELAPAGASAPSWSNCLAEAL